MRFLRIAGCMAHLKKVHYGDLLLLRDLFCGNGHRMCIYDPLSCLTGEEHNDKVIVSGDIPDASAGGIIFNLSYELLPEKTEADYSFHFNVSSTPRAGNYYYLNNPDGTMRWIFPSQSETPHFLT